LILLHAVRTTHKDNRARERNDMKGHSWKVGAGEWLQ